jgi:hypothetical protein
MLGVEIILPVFLLNFEKVITVVVIDTAFDFRN